MFWFSVCSWNSNSSMNWSHQCFWIDLRSYGVFEQIMLGILMKGLTHHRRFLHATIKMLTCNWLASGAQLHIQPHMKKFRGRRHVCKRQPVYERRIVQTCRYQSNRCSFERENRCARSLQARGNLPMLCDALFRLEFSTDEDHLWSNCMYGITCKARTQRDFISPFCM